MSGREDFTWLAHGRELREMWCCPLPKGLGTSQGSHGLVYTGQPQGLAGKTMNKQSNHGT